MLAISSFFCEICVFHRRTKVFIQIIYKHLFFFVWVFVCVGLKNSCEFLWLLFLYENFSNVKVLLVSDLAIFLSVCLLCDWKKCGLEKLMSWHSTAELMLKPLHFYAEFTNIRLQTKIQRFKTCCSKCLIFHEVCQTRKPIAHSQM